MDSRARSTGIDLSQSAQRMNPPRVSEKSKFSWGQSRFIIGVSKLFGFGELDDLLGCLGEQLDHVFDGHAVRVCRLVHFDAPLDAAISGAVDEYRDVEADLAQRFLHELACSGHRNVEFWEL